MTLLDSLLGLPTKRRGYLSPTDYKIDTTGDPTTITIYDETVADALQNTDSQDVELTAGGGRYTESVICTVVEADTETDTTVLKPFDSAELFDTPDEAE